MLSQINNTLRKHATAVTVGLTVMVVVPFVMFTDAGDSLLDSRGSSKDRVIGQIDGQDIVLADAKQYESAIRLTVALEYNQAANTIPENALLSRIALLKKVDAEANLASVSTEDVKNYLLNDTQIKAIQAGVQLTSLNDTLKFLRSRYLNLGGNEFDKIIKENVLIKKHEESLKAAATVTDEDAKKAFTKDNTEYAFKARNYSYLPFADEEIKKAYDANLKDFETPDAVQAQVISISAATFNKEADNDKTKALELAVAKAESFLKTLSEKTKTSADKAQFKDALFQRTLKATAKAADLTLESSDWLTQDNITNGNFFLNNKELTEAILALTPEKNTSTVIKSETAVYVAFFTKKGHTKSLAEARTEILEKLYGEGVQAYFDKNKAQFKTQKQFSATAVQFNAAQFLSKVDEATITDKMIQSAYDQQVARYGQKQVQIITLSAAIDKETKAEKKAEFKKEIEVALAEIAKSNGDDFKKNEAKYTEKGITATKSTWTNEDALDATFKALVESTEKNKASEIKEEAEQIAAVYVLDKRDNTPIEEATVTITANIKNQLATAKAFEAAAEFQKSLPNGQDLKALTLKTVELAEAAGAKVSALPKGSGQSFFQNLMQASIVPKLTSMQAYQAFFNATNSLSPTMPTTTPVETQSGVAILVLKEYDASRPQTLEEVRNRILEVLSNQKGAELAQAAATKDLEAYSTVTKFDENPDKAKFTDKAAKKFSTLTANDKKAAEKAEAAGVYHLEKTQSGAEILFVSSVKKPTDKEIEEGYKATLETLKTEAGNKALEKFYTELNESIKVVQEEVAVK